MSYESPIELITSQYCSSIENAIYQSVLKVGIDVDKEELLRALEYDRGQYQKGYDDRDAAIVRCKDCKHYRINTVYPGTNLIMTYCAKTGIAVSNPDWFCADGEEK